MYCTNIYSVLYTVYELYLISIQKIQSFIYVSKRILLFVSLSIYVVHALRSFFFLSFSRKGKGSDRYVYRENEKDCYTMTAIYSRVSPCPCQT